MGWIVWEKKVTSQEEVSVVVQWNHETKKGGSGFEKASLPAEKEGKNLQMEGNKAKNWGLHWSYLD